MMGGLGAFVGLHWSSTMINIDDWWDVFFFILGWFRGIHF